MRNGASVTYLHGDHLGSTATTTGSQVSTQRYLPYGAQRSAGNVATPYRYTAQRWEADLGLYDYNARWYDPVLGRFVQADTIVPEPGNPQSLNRYAYCLNNPLVYIDDDGHIPIIPILAAAAFLLVGGVLADTPEAGAQIEVPEANRVVAEVAAGAVAEPLDWALTINRVAQGQGDAVDIGLMALPGALGCLRRVTKLDEVAELTIRVERASDALPSTGQWHHVLSAKITQALSKHPTLAGLFRRNDILVQAADQTSHWGYQGWHRLLDNKVLDWIAKGPTATQIDFLEFLSEVYSGVNLRERFPWAIPLLEQMIEEASR